MRPAVACRLGAGLLALLVAGCCDLNAAYRRDLDRDARARREGVRNDASGHHVGLQVQLGALARWANRPEGLGLLPRFEQAVSLATLGVPVGLRLEAGVTGIDLAASDRCVDCLRVDAAVSATLSLDAPPLVAAALSWPPEGFRLGGRLSVEAGLRAAADPATAEVWLDLTDPAVIGLDLALELLPDEIEDGIRAALEPLAGPVARALLSRFKILEVPPLEVGSTRIQVAIAALRVDPGSRRLYVGLRTNLAVEAADAVRPDLSAPPRAEVEIRMAPSLPELTLRALLDQGVVPRRYDGSIRPDPEGPLHATLVGLRLREGRVEAPFRIWRLGWPCFVADLVARGRVDRNPEGRFAVTLEAIALERTTAFEPQLRRALWKQSRLARAVAEVTERYLNARWIQLGESGGLGWHPLGYRLSPEGIAIDGELR